MKRLALLLLLLSIVSPVAALERAPGSSQKVMLFAFTTADNTPKTGDAANISCYQSIDGAAAAQLTDTSASEIDSTNLKGWYVFDITSAETDGKDITIGGKSSTAGVTVVGRVYTTTAPNFAKAAIDSSGRGQIQYGTSTGQLSATAGVPNTNVASINSVSTSSVTTVNANLGTTQPVNFQGTGSSAYVKSDVQSALGTAWTSGAITSGVFASGAITATAMATDCITNAEIATTAAQEIADANRNFVAAITATQDGTTTTFEFTGGASVTNFYVGMGITTFDASNSSLPHEAVVTAYDSGTGIITFSPAASYTIATGDTAVLHRVRRQDYATWLKLPSKSYLAGSSNSDGDVQLDEATGSLASGAIAAASFASGAIDATAIAANAIGASEMAADSITSSELATTAATEIWDNDPRLLLSTTATAGSGGTSLVLATAGLYDDSTSLTGHTAYIYDASDSSKVCVRQITSWDGTITNTAELDSAPDFTVANGDVVKIYTTPKMRVGTSGIVAASFASGAVDATAIAANAIGAAEIADDSIDAGAIAASAIGASEIATDAVGAAEIAAAAITSSEAPNLDAAVSSVSGAYISDSGTAQAGASGTITLASGASSTNDLYKYQLVTATGGTGAGQARFISAYNGTTKVASVSRNWDTAPDNTTTYRVTGFDQVPGASAPTANENAAAVWDLATSGHTNSGTFGEQLKTDVDAILDDTGTSGVQIPPGEIVAGTFGSGALDAVWSTTSRTLSGTINDFDELLAGSDDFDDAFQASATTFFGAGGVNLSALPWNASWDTEVESEATDAANAYGALKPTTTGRTLDVSAGGGAEMDLSQAVPASNTANTTGDCLNAARAQAVGKWTLNSSTRELKIYSSDGTTVIGTLLIGPNLTAPLNRTPQ